MRSLQRALMGAALVGLIAGSAVAQERAVQRDVDVDVRVGAEADAQSAGGFYKASDLIGMEVHGQNNEDIGEVQDLLVDSATNEIEYLVLDTGLFADLDGKQPILPWGVVDVHAAADADEHYILVPLTEERIKTAPALNIAEVDLMRSATWIDQVDTFYEADINQRRTARPDLDRDADNADRPRNRRNPRPDATDRNPNRTGTPERDPARPDTTDRDSTTPQPGAAKPDTDKPNADKPDTPKPDTDKPEATEQPKPRTSNP
jgi:sporulation protein YlmC with PRC-barrel domain